LSVNRRFGGTYRLHLQGRRNKFSKKAGGKLRYIAEIDTLHDHRCENLKSYITIIKIEKLNIFDSFLVLLNLNLNICNLNSIISSHAASSE
jgi:hypothetical protein